MTAVLHEGRRINPPPPVGYRSFGQPPTLTPRQTEVLRWRALGLTNPAVADALGVSEFTVRTLIARAFRSTNAACLVDALRAVGWLQVPAA